MKASWVTCLFVCESKFQVLLSLKYPRLFNLHSKYLVTFCATQVKQCSNLNGMQCFMSAQFSFQVVLI